MTRDEPQFALQLFNGREYETTLTGGRRALEEPFERAATLGKPRRIVRTDKARPARPSYRRPPQSRASDRSREDVVKEYLAWAAARGLESVAAYRTDWRAVVHAKRYPIALRLVDPADFIGPVTEDPAEQEA